MDLLTLRFGPEGRMKRMNKLIRIVPHGYLPKVREKVSTWCRVPCLPGSMQQPSLMQTEFCIRNCRPESDLLTTIVLLSVDLDRLYVLCLGCLSTYD